MATTINFDFDGNIKRVEESRKHCLESISINKRRLDSAIADLHRAIEAEEAQRRETEKHLQELLKSLEGF